MRRRRMYSVPALYGQSVGIIEGGRRRSRV
jgi:hypothetical protein